MYMVPEQLFANARQRFGGDDDAKAFFSDQAMLGRFNEWIRLVLAHNIKATPITPVEKSFAASPPSSPPASGEYTILCPPEMTRVTSVQWKLAGGIYRPLATAQEKGLIADNYDPHVDIGSPHSYWVDVAAPAASSVSLHATTAVTKATNGVAMTLAAAAHGFTTGQLVLISGCGGMPEINGQICQVTVKDADEFYTNIDTSAYTATGTDGTASAYTAAAVVNVHPYPIPNVACTILVRGEGLPAEQALGKPLTIPWSFIPAALRWLIYDMRDAREEFNDQAREYSRQIYEKTMQEALRHYNFMVKDRTIENRVNRTIGE